MSEFARRIESAHPTLADLRNRRWIWVPYDRFTDSTGPLTEQPPESTGIVIVESTAKAHRRLYHKKKLALLIANMRHFALEQAARGVRVLYHFSPLSHGQALAQLQREQPLPRLTGMEPAERELRLDLAQAITAGLAIDLVPDTTWLSTPQDFLSVYGPFASGRRYVMDRFYRAMRHRTGTLMENGHPIGGQFSYDEENRRAYRGQPPVPTPPSFPPDSITQEVIDMVAREYPQHFGSLGDFDLPVTAEDCARFWRFSLEHLLPYFGPYEDAMRDDHLNLFHSRVSALVNLGRLLPADLIRDVEAAQAAGRVPLASAEGFIRQLLGWREYMRHIHRETDGYRMLDVSREDDSPPSPDPLAGARPSALAASRPLPAAYWGVPSGLHCLDTVVAQVLREGWSHHITRLMVLSNLATLAGFSPRQLTDWFWIGYVDAYDWVVEPNVLGMATYADGGLTATKPYVSGAAYINRMSNYCGRCQYDPKRTTGPGSCPFTALYWSFLERHQDTLAANPRLRLPYTTLRKKSAEEMSRLRERAEAAIAELEAAPHPEY